MTGQIAEGAGRSGGPRAVTMRLALALALLMTVAAPARAQGVADPDCFPFAPGCERLPQLMDDLNRQIAPLLQDLAGRLNPFVADLQELLGDLSGWDAPEVLPNGDILIRSRRAPEIMPGPEEPPPRGSVPEPGRPESGQSEPGQSEGGEPDGEMPEGDETVTEPFEL